VSFGSFELNPSAGELRKQGIRIKLHDKPLQLLLALLKHPGEVVTRKELQELLWPSDTFVEFENGLNNAISRLREALGDTAESPRFIETIPRRGYRFLAEVSSAVASSPASGSFRHWLLAILFSVGAALVLGVASHFVPPRHPAIHSLAVLPFRNLGAGTPEEYFTDGMTDAVTTELAKLGVSKIISETSVAQFKDTKKSVPEIARALSVDAIVEGAVLREGNQVRITVQLIRADTDQHVWAQSYQRQMTDILALQDEVALGVARAIKLELSPGAAAQSASPQSVNAEAYEAYLKGRYFMQKRDESFLRAKDYFEQAIQLDPGYAPAYAGLSGFYVLALPPKEALPKAKEYTQKALQLDPNLPEGHVSLAYIYFFEDWNWPAAGEEFQRAISLAPGLAESHHWYAVYLSAMGRTAEAMGEAQRALELDPLSISAHDGAAVVAASAKQYDRCIDEGRKIRELDPNDPRAYLDMGVGHLQKGMYQEALQDMERGLALSHRDPFFLSIAAYAYGRLGNMEQANKLVQEMPAAIQQSPASPSPSMLFATAFVGTGKQKEAIEALEEGYKLHDADLVGLNAAPWFEPLRSDPRFQDLLHRMNFPK
jgi:TolB-like protein/DNA-binding winged helix-turn-helix (wHTH) protein/Flp pilus assembly protein TadD